MKYDFYRLIVEGKELPSEEEIFYEILQNDAIKLEIQFAEHIKDIKEKYPSLCCLPNNFINNKIFTVEIDTNSDCYELYRFSNEFKKDEGYTCNLVIGNGIFIDEHTNDVVKEFKIKHETLNDVNFIIFVSRLKYYFFDLKEAKEFLRECLFTN